MDVLEFSNNASSKIVGSIAPGDTTIHLAVGSGAEFPAPMTGFSFRATLTDPTRTIREIVSVTTRLNDQVTVVRGQEGTTALAWADGTTFEALTTAETLNRFVQWNALGLPTKSVDLGSGGGAFSLDLSGLPVGAPTVVIALTAGAISSISNITGAVMGVSVILAVLETSHRITIPLDTAPFLLSNNSGTEGWPGYPGSSISFFYNPLNPTYTWIEQSRTWRIS